MVMQEVKKNPRVVMYSHDTMGLGHFRRNLLIANELSKSSVFPNILLISGAREAEYFSLPQNVECLTLPSLFKEKDGQYRSRRLEMSLFQIVELRKKILHSAITSFEPEVLIVDGVPWGVEGELVPTLAHLNANKNTRCIFGIRDVWDEPGVIKKEWNKRNNFDAIRRYYDQIWIYGDKSVYDPVYEYSLSEEIKEKVRFTGYLYQKPRLGLMTFRDQLAVQEILKTIDGPFVLCLLGSGQDGDNLAQAFINSKLPPGHKGVILTGPHMNPKSRERLFRQAEKNPRIIIIEFCNEPTAILQKASCVVAMGGYNTICEILSFRKKALIVPRVIPRKEQLIRASRLQSKGYLNVLRPDKLDSHSLSKWFESNQKQIPNYEFKMTGLSTISNLFTSILYEMSQSVLTYPRRNSFA